MKLTIKTIEQVQPSSKELYFWDDDLPGYGLRVMLSCPPIIGPENKLGFS